MLSTNGSSAGGLRGGRIKFVAGSWGSGKTHLFRVLTEKAQSEGILVSTVELSQDEAPFNKLEMVVGRVVRNIGLSEAPSNAEPLEHIIRTQALRRSGGSSYRDSEIEAMCRSLMAEEAIDADVRRVISAYLRTLPAPESDVSAINDRALLMDWFLGEGTQGEMRRRFGVNSMVTKETARSVLGSLGALARWLGRNGLLILLDESEMSHSVMRNSDRAKAHNNLLHLINSIGDIEGVMLVYAAVPEFWLDEKSGIKNYGALSARIGQIPEKSPRALANVWNIDLLGQGENAYSQASLKIRDIYLLAYPEDAESLPGVREMRQKVEELVRLHPERHAVSYWRIVVQGAIAVLDEAIEGVGERPIGEVYRDVLDMMESSE